LGTKNKLPDIYNAISGYSWSHRHFVHFFISFDLTHIESRISPNIKILFCWSQRL